MAKNGNGNKRKAASTDDGDDEETTRRNQQSRLTNLANRLITDSGNAMATSEQRTNSDAKFTKMVFNSCDDGEVEVGEIAAVFDDEPDEDPVGSFESEKDKEQSWFFQNSDYGKFLVEIMEQIQFECRIRASSNKTKKQKKDDSRRTHWIIDFLKAQGFWIRTHHASFILKKLGLSGVLDTTYFRDVKVWMPDLQYGKAGGMPCCPSCKSNARVGVNKHPVHYPARKIIGMDDWFALMSRQYYCSSCKELSTKEKPIQHNFYASHSSCLKMMPDHISNEFPAILSHKAGIDKVLHNLLRPLLDKSFQFEALSKMLLELHSKKYFLSYIGHLSKYEKSVLRSDVKPFSEFDDKLKYAGAVPSANYLSSMYKKQGQEIRALLDQEVKKIACKTLAVDGSSKAANKISQFNGRAKGQCLMTGKNELGQIRLQCLQSTESHDQLIGPVQAMVKTQEAMGQSLPELVMTDNPTRDDTFFRKHVPSVQATQDRLDKIAEIKNELDKDGSSYDEQDQQANSLNRIEQAARARLGFDAPTKTSTESSDSSSDDEDEDIPLSILRGSDAIVVKPGSVGTAIDAMLAATGSVEGGVFAIDMEWQTKRTSHGHPRKSDKVGVLAIAYRDTRDKFGVLICQLPRSAGVGTNEKGILQARLVAFLSDPQNKFIGVGLKSDFKVLESDYRNFNHNMVPADSIINLSAMARDRDMAASDAESLQTLCKNVLKVYLDKNNEVRCSDWSKANLSPEQIKYSALDVIRPLQIYEKLKLMRDLSIRLAPELTVPGMKVDIVPPHARGKPRQPARGFGLHVADLTTRAAIGKISADIRVINPGGIEPPYSQAVPENSVVVEVEEVLAESLLLPRYKSSHDKRQKISLKEFGEAPFKLVLPVSMLRLHVDAASQAGSDARNLETIARTYEPPQRTVARQPTPPSTEPATSNTSEEAALLDDIVELTEDEEDWSDGVVDGALGLLEDLMEELANDIDEMTQEEKSAMMNKIQEQLDTLRRCEKLSSTAAQGDTGVLYSKHLDDLPGYIPYKFSAVLGDPFHAIQRMKVPVHHEVKKAYFCAAMNAFFIWDEKKLDEVKTVLREKAGMSDEDIEALMFYSPRFFQRRVPRFVPDPRRLYYRLRAVYCTFGDKIDTKTKRPLFNSAAWTKANQVLKEVLKGYYSDPPGYDFYTYEIKENGEIKRDKWGIKLIHCSRGTNLVENVHKSYNTTFRYAVGFELGDCMLAERRHRHNIDMGRARIRDYPHVGHYDTWLIDRVKGLAATVLKRNAFKSWVPSSNFRNTPETFVTVAIHSKELGDKLEHHWNEKVDQEKVKLSKDLQFLCKQTNVPLPFLPVFGEAEYKLFSEILHRRGGKFDDKEIAMEWIDAVDGIAIFPKLPAHTRAYYRRWEKNQRIRTAVKRTKAQAVDLEAVTKKNTPTQATQTATNNSSERPSRDTHPTQNQQLVFPPIRYPVAMPAPAVQALNPLMAPVYVNHTFIGGSVGLPNTSGPVQTRMPGQRGSDRTKDRKPRTCQVCKEKNLPASRYSICPGRVHRSRCETLNDAGRNHN